MVLPSKGKPGFCSGEPMPAPVEGRSPGRFPVLSATLPFVVGSSMSGTYAQGAGAWTDPGRYFSNWALLSAINPGMPKTVANCNAL